MSFDALAAQMKVAGAGPLVGIPYAETLGAEYRTGNGQVTLVVPFRKSLIGTPQPPRLHGGAVAGLMELTAIAQVIHHFRDEDVLPDARPINVTVDYLRAGQTETVFAAARIVRMGRRVANVEVEAWQEERARPIAAAHMNVMLRR